MTVSRLPVFVEKIEAPRKRADSNVEPASESYPSRASLGASRSSSFNISTAPSSTSEHDFKYLESIEKEPPVFICLRIEDFLEITTDL